MPKIFQTLEEFEPAFTADAAALRKELIDDLIWTAVFAADGLVREAAIWMIRQSADRVGVRPASIQPLYDAVGQGKAGGFTVPAVNVRGFTYDFARAVFRVAGRCNAGAFIFEIAKSEMGYTNQRPAEYAASVLAAAVKENYDGPVFIQGDHIQFSPKNFKKDPKAEIDGIKSLSRECIEAGFFNIDIDASTLVVLQRPTLRDQQKENIDCQVEMVRYIRGLQPVEISIGCEIGEVGGKNSTVEEFEAFASGVKERLGGMKGPSKVSIQAGTRHGGVVLPDGRVAEVDVDFQAHQAIAESARAKFGMAGTVQHGASTLTEDLFDQFPKAGTVEIHLATEFQNIIYRNLPEEFTQRIYGWIKKELRDEFKAEETEEQNLYRTRKKAFGPFKKEFWELDKSKILPELEAKFESLFRRLNAVNTRSVVNDFVRPPSAVPPMPAALTRFAR